MFGSLLCCAHTTTLQECRNNNIVQFYGACLREECMMIVTEYMKGGDLYNALHGRSNGDQWLWRARYHPEWQTLYKPCD